MSDEDGGFGSDGEDGILSWVNDEDTGEWREVPPYVRRRRMHVFFIVTIVGLVFFLIARC